MGGKLYLAGDGAVRSADRGYFRITGRIDDVLNVSGHRMGTMEIESALVSKTDLVAEAAVVGRPDDLTGEAICAFVVLKRSRPTGDEAKAIAKELRDWVAKEIGPIAKPKDIRFGDNLPKTRSGKIMRRLLRSLAKGEPSRRTPPRWKTRPFWISWARPKTCRAPLGKLLLAQHPSRQLLGFGFIHLRVGRHGHGTPDTRATFEDLDSQFVCSRLVSCIFGSHFLVGGADQFFIHCMARHAVFGRS
jgi:hypothetical protein